MIVRFMYVFDFRMRLGEIKLDSLGMVYSCCSVFDNGFDHKEEFHY